MRFIICGTIGDPDNLPTIEVVEVLKSQGIDPYGSATVRPYGGTSRKVALANVFRAREDAHRQLAHRLRLAAKKLNDAAKEHEAKAKGQ